MPSRKPLTAIKKAPIAIKETMTASKKAVLTIQSARLATFRKVLIVMKRSFTAVKENASQESVSCHPESPRCH